jgi:hypothetical protein
MTGSSLAPVIIPIVVLACLAVCLTIVYYAASHPEWKSTSPALGHETAKTASASPAPRHQIADSVGSQRGDPGSLALKAARRSVR